MSQARKGSCSALQMQCYLFWNAPCADLAWRLGQGRLSRSVIMLGTQPHPQTDLQLFGRETAVPGCNLAWWPPWWYFCSDKLLPAWPHLVGHPRDLYQLWVYSISILKWIKSTSAQPAATAAFLWGFGTVGVGRDAVGPGKEQITPGQGLYACCYPAEGQTGALTASRSHTAGLKFAACIDPHSKTEPLPGKAGLAV